MPLANFDDIQNGLIKHIRAVIGSDLSTLTVPTGADPLAAVIKDRTEGPRPDYPYVLVDRASSVKTQEAWLRHQEVVETSEDVFEVSYKTEQTLTVNITCYGDFADDLLNKLRISGNDVILRTALNEATGAVFQYYSDTDRTPIYLETDFVDAASIDAYFTVVSDWIPPNSSTIEVVTGGSNVNGSINSPVSTQLYVEENIIP